MLYDTRICVNCALYHVNGDTTSLDDLEASRMIVGIDEHVGPEFHVLVGEPVGFLMSPCGSCGSNLGGERYYAVLMPINDNLANH